MKDGTVSLAAPVQSRIWRGLPHVACDRLRTRRRLMLPTNARMPEVFADLKLSSEH